MEPTDGPVTRTELRQELRALEERLDARFGQVDAHFGQVDARFGQMEDRFGQMEDRLVEQMRDMQTEIIRALVDVQQNNENRLGHLEKTDAAVLERLAHVEKQLLEVRIKLLMEPPAA
jgi:hypothetical protein